MRAWIIASLVLGGCQEIGELGMPPSPDAGTIEPEDLGLADVGTPDAGAPPCWQEVGFIGAQQERIREIGRRVAWAGDRLFVAGFRSMAPEPTVWAVLRVAQTADGWAVDRYVDGRQTGALGFLVEGFATTADHLWLGTVHDDDLGAVWQLSHELDIIEGPLRSPEEGVEFGYAIAASGSLVFIGDPSHDGHRGAVYVFEITSGAPAHIDTIRSSTPTVGARFGQAIAVDQDRLLIGAPTCEIEASCSGVGSIEMFRYSDQGAQRLRRLQPESERVRGFGAAVSWLGEDQALVSAPNTYTCVDRCYTTNERRIPPAGSMGCAANEVPCEFVGTVFTVDGEEISEIPRQAISKRLERRGNALAANDAWLVIGAFGDTSCSVTIENSFGCPTAGAVHVFPRDPTDGEPRKRYLRTTDFSLSARFGSSVALSEHRLAIGARVHCGALPGGECSSSGAVFVYEGCR